MLNISEDTAVAVHETKIERLSVDVREMRDEQKTIKDDIQDISRKLDKMTSCAAAAGATAALFFSVLWKGVSVVASAIK